MRQRKRVHPDDTIKEIQALYNIVIDGKRRFSTYRLAGMYFVDHKTICAYLKIRLEG